VECSADIDFSNRARTTRAQHGCDLPVIREPIDSKRDDQMNARLNSGSAKIYQFPVGGRAALGNYPQDEARSSPDQSSSSVNAAACSGSWYHEAAIQESEPARKR
jgi:Protein of unknown function (DUF2735)